MSGLGAVFKILGGSFTEACDCDKRRTQLAVLGYFELRRARLIKVDRRKFKAAHVKLVDRFKRCQNTVLVGGRVFFLTQIIYLAAHFVKTGSHHFSVEAVFLTAAVEIRAVKCQRLMDLDPCNSERHHDICDGMRFREKIRDLAA